MRKHGEMGASEKDVRNLRKDPPQSTKISALVVLERVIDLTFHVVRLATAETLYMSAHPPNRSARASHAKSCGGRQ